MTLCYFLMLLSELSLYFVGANCVLYSAGGINGIPTILICVLVGTLGYLLDEKFSKFRFLLLPFLLLVLRYGTNFASYLIVILPAAYVGLNVIFRRYYMEYDEKVSFVKLGMALSAFLFFAFVFIMGLDRILTYILLFLVSGIFMLRMLRQNIKIAKDPKYRMMNFITVAGVVILALILGSDAFLSTAGSLVKSFHENVTAPVIDLVIKLAMQLLSVIFQILKSIFPELTPKIQELEMNIEQGGGQAEEAKAYEPGNFVDTLILIAKVVAVLLSIAALILLVFRARKGRNKLSMDPIVEGRTTVQNMRMEEKLYSDRIVPREPRAAVRYYYRKFLRVCDGIGITFPRHYTTKYIENTVSGTFPDEDLKSMRETYLKARYSDENITQEDVASIKADVKKMKEHINQQEKDSGKYYRS